MAWFLVALIAVPILATLWAVGFGVMAAREKKILWRLLCGLLALVGSVYAAAGWLLLSILVIPRFAAGVQVEAPIPLGSHGRSFFAGLGVIALVIAGRAWWTRLQGKP